MLKILNFVSLQGPKFSDLDQASLYLPIIVVLVRIASKTLFRGNSLSVVTGFSFVSLSFARVTTTMPEVSFLA